MTRKDLEVRTAAKQLIAEIRRVLREKAIRIEVALAKKTYTVGESIGLTARIHNTGGEPIMVCGALDGSFVGWRCATYSLAVTRISGEPCKKIARLRCGNVGSRQKGVPPLMAKAVKGSWSSKPIVFTIIPKKK